MSLAALAVSLPLTLMSACSAGPPAAAVAARQAGAVVIDVRSAAEWQSGHAEQATLIPIDELDARLAEVEALVGGDKQRPIVVVCRSGARAGRARELLLSKGFTHVENGGAWQNMR